jgi:hypothetical protein
VDVAGPQDSEQNFPAFISAGLDVGDSSSLPRLAP